MGNEKYIYGYTPGTIYECSWFDDGMNGCSGRFMAVVRNRTIVFKELDSPDVHTPDEFFYIGKSEDQYPHERIVFQQIED